MAKYLIMLLDPFGQSLHTSEIHAQEVSLASDPDPIDTLTPLMDGCVERRIVLDPHRRASFSVQITKVLT